MTKSKRIAKPRPKTKATKKRAPKPQQKSARPVAQNQSP